MHKCKSFDWLELLGGWVGTWARMFYLDISDVFLYIMVPRDSGGTRSSVLFGKDSSV